MSYTRPQSRYSPMSACNRRTSNGHSIGRPLCGNLSPRIPTHRPHPPTTRQLHFYCCHNKDIRLWERFSPILHLRQTAFGSLSNTGFQVCHGSSRCECVYSYAFPLLKCDGLIRRSRQIAGNSYVREAKSPGNGKSRPFFVERTDGLCIWNLMRF